jgi:type I restriction enzyme S subunit
MPRRRSSKPPQTSSGMDVPEGWEVRHIRDLGEVMSGRQRSPHHKGGTLRPYLRVANIMDGYVDADDVLTMPFTDDEYQRFVLKPGDLLLNEGQSLDLVGRCAIYAGTPPNCCFQNTLIRFRPNEGLTPEFAWQLFRFLGVTGQFSRIANQTTSIAHLGLSRFAELRVRLPPLDERDVVCEAITKWDRGLSALDRLLAAKERRKQALMQRLLWPCFGTAAQKSSRLRQGYGGQANDWITARLGDIAEEVVRRNEHGVIVLSCTKTRGLVPSLEYFGKRVHSLDTSNYKVVRRGEFAYATNHIEEGSIGFLEEHDAGLVSPMYTVFRVREDVCGAFLYRLLKTEHYRRVFEARTHASVDRRGSLRWPEFSAISVTLPPKKHQEQLTRFFDLCDRELALLRRLREALEKQKRGLMQVLLTGRVRVGGGRGRRVGPSAVETRHAASLRRRGTRPPKRRLRRKYR